MTESQQDFLGDVTLYKWHDTIMALQIKYVSKSKGYAPKCFILNSDHNAWFETPFSGISGNYVGVYANINIISHSWGTTLSYDLMNSSDIEVHNWVTMGSPLKQTTEMPRENTGNWFNYYSLKDPVMHYELYPPFPGIYQMAHAVWTGVGGGPGLSEDRNTFNHPRYDMLHTGFDEHGAYWNDPNVLSDLRNDLQ